MTEDVYIKIIAMPTSIRSYVLELPDGAYCIVLNSNLTFENRLKAYEHELRHINNKDFEGVNDLDDVEKRCHEGD